MSGEALWNLLWKLRLFLSYTYFFRIEFFPLLRTGFQYCGGRIVYTYFIMQSCCQIATTVSKTDIQVRKPTRSIYFVLNVNNKRLGWISESKVDEKVTCSSIISPCVAYLVNPSCERHLLLSCIPRLYDACLELLCERQSDYN